MRAWSGGGDGAASFTAVRKAPSSVAAPRSTASRASVSRTTVAFAASHGSSIPVRAMRPVPFGTKVHSRLARPEHEQFRTRPALAPHEPDGALQTRAGVAKSPSLLGGFEGINVDSGAAANGGHFWSPPDPTGAVGPNNYVQAVNTELSIYDRQGNTIAGPVDLKSLWATTTSLCKDHDDGDPIVVYDQLADRWLISQFAVSDAPPDYHECIAVSKTGDPAGAYWSYDFKISDTRFNDYPKIGVWADGYYATFNDSVGDDFAGITVAAFERAKMLNGQAAKVVAHHTSFPADQDYSMLPADLNGRLAPPANAPALFAESFDGSPDVLEVWSFRVDFAASTGTFTRIARLPTAAFDSDLCRFELDCLPQPSTSSGLDAISDRLMQPLSYRNFGDHESMVVDQTVDVNGQDHAGIRWYELRRIGSGQWSIVQQGTYAPDSANRWMGSMAMDGNGNVALGYSVASQSVFPSLRYATRLAGGAKDELEAEETMIAGGGSQTGDGHRWGDYSTMAIDPTDDCTFWYVGEYYSAPTSELEWKTLIGHFRIPSCVGVTGFSPASGGLGAPVTVNGLGFTSASQVKFGGVAAPTTFVSATTLTATVPAGSRTGQISVTTGSNTGVTAATFTVTTPPVPAPTLGGFTPLRGITGSKATISGTVFEGVTSVKFNGVPVPSYSVLSTTSISATVPDGVTTGAISVTTPSGTATSLASYIVTLSITGFRPTSGRAGTRVKISGVGFNLRTRPIVRLNGKKMTNVRVGAGGKQVSATVPAGATSGKITVQNRAAPVGTVRSPGTFTKR